MPEITQVLTQGGAQAILSAVVIVLWREIRRLNKSLLTMNLKIGRLEAKLEDCIQHQVISLADYQEQVKKLK